jgi:tetratricopeptide (TPR) repeat protein
MPMKKPFPAPRLLKTFGKVKPGLTGASARIKAEPSLQPEAEPGALLESRLISFRQDLKNGFSDRLNVEELQPQWANNVVIKAEVYFLRGSILMHQKNFAAATADMAAAAKLYVQTEALEKALLSEFNTLVAQVNLGMHEFKVSLRLFSELSLQSEIAGFEKVVGLCFRQKSYLYFDNHEFSKAFELIERAIRIFSVQGLQSDYDLSLVHSADCAFESGKLEKARTLLDFLPEASELDQKVKFPFAYVQAKLTGQPLDLSHFDFIPVLWRHRYEKSRLTSSTGL